MLYLRKPRLREVLRNLPKAIVNKGQKQNSNQGLWICILCWSSFFFFFLYSIFFPFSLKIFCGFLNVQKWIFWKEMSLIKNQEIVCSRVVWQDLAALSNTSYHDLRHLHDILVRTEVLAPRRFCSHPLQSGNWALSHTEIFTISSFPSIFWNRI